MRVSSYNRRSFEHPYLPLPTFPFVHKGRDLIQLEALRSDIAFIILSTLISKIAPVKLIINQNRHTAVKLINPNRYTAVKLTINPNRDTAVKLIINSNNCTAVKLVMNPSRYTAVKLVINPNRYTAV